MIQDEACNAVDVDLRLSHDAADERGKAVVVLFQRGGDARDGGLVVVVEAAAERGREPDARDVDAARGKKARAALEQVERRIQIDPVLGGGSVGKLEVGVKTMGQNYVLVDPRFGTSHTINRETLELTIQSFGNTLKGSCKVAQKSKNQI